MAINQAATQSVANGIAKRVHGDVVDMIPKSGNKFIRRVPYSTKKTLGSTYAEQVWLTGEHGFTYGGSSGGKRTLNASEVAESQLAELAPTAIDFRSEVTIDLMSRARARGEAAFENYIVALMRNAKKAFDSRLEVAMNYGGSGIGTISSASSSPSTTIVITIDGYTWAPGFWLGKRNCAIDVYSGATQKNSRADLNITKVDMHNKQITAVGNASDITDILAVGTNGSGCIVYYKGAKGNDGTGVSTVAALTTGTTYLGISTTNYMDVWNGTQITWDQAANEFTWAILNSGIEEAAGRGLESDIIVSVPFPQWSKLNNSLDALRIFDSSYSVNRTDMGRDVDSITYHTLTGGTARVEPSIFRKYGEIICYPDPGGEDADIMKRIGSTNITFQTPLRGDDMFLFTPDANTVEYRAFSDQALWAPCPRNFIRFGT